MGHKGDAPDHTADVFFMGYDGKLNCALGPGVADLLMVGSPRAAKTGRRKGRE